MSPIRALLTTLAVLASSCATFADGLFTTLVGPAETVAPAATLSLSVFAANTGHATLDFVPPPQLAGSLWQNEKSWEVVLRIQPGGYTASVLSGGFATCAYSLTLPAGITGRVILEIAQGLPMPVRAVISVAEVNEGAFSPHPAEAEAANGLSENRTAVSTLQRAFLDRFSALDPIYFVYGPKAPNAKFQFSFKYRLLSFDGGGEESPESTLQFGYTQRSLWDLNASSSPFYDTSYMPSLFYQFFTAAPRDQNKGGVTWLGFQTGYSHESNGQASTESRSVNTMFVRSGLLFGRPDGWHAITQIRILDYVGGLSNNPDLKDYRGYGDWQVIVAQGAGSSLSYTGRAGNDLNHFTSQFDLNIPIKTKFLDFATYFLIQYFDGYGESLRAYNKYSDTVRAGVSLVR